MKPLYSTGSGPCRAEVGAILLAKKEPRATAVCMATWGKKTAPWFKKERSRIAAEVEANKRGTK